MTHGFYVLGTNVSLQNFLSLMDDFFVWKEKKMACEQPFEVRARAFALTSTAWIMNTIR